MRPVPRISTRGNYDLESGRTLRRGGYRLYPARYFGGLAGAAELTVVVHGLRNDCAGALQKAAIARRRFRALGYAHPVVGFSYDSNTAGAHVARRARHALAVGRLIAGKNGRHLGRFVEDLAGSSPGTRVRLVGHSLGSQVVLGALGYLDRRGRRGAVEAAYLFGASVPADAPSPGRYYGVLQRAVRRKVVNYFAPTDGVLASAGDAAPPLGLAGAAGRTPPKYAQRRVRPRNHRFASYVAELRSFP